MFTKTVLILLSLCCIANAQVFFSGKCPSKVDLKPNFEVNKYLGKWYEWAKYPFAFEPNGKCTSATYAAREDGNVSVFNELVDKTTNKPDTIEGFATLVGNAKLKVSFPVAPAFNVESNYWILDTDYTNYSVVYSCSETVKEGVEGHNLIVWILTRERSPTAYVIAGALNVVQSQQLSLKNMEITTQYGCEAASS